MCHSHRPTPFFGYVSIRESVNIDQVRSGQVRGVGWGRRVTPLFQYLAPLLGICTVVGRRNIGNDKRAFGKFFIKFVYSGICYCLKLYGLNLLVVFLVYHHSNTCLIRS